MNRYFLTLLFWGALTNTFAQTTNIFPSTGNVGIGTTTPTAGILQINGSGDLISLSSDGNVVQVNAYNNSDFRIIQRNNAIMTLWTSTTERMRIDQNGNVGIGTTNPEVKLAVNGTIHSKEVKVDLIGWPDYVFKPTYHLPTLAEVKAYINKNQHLPDVPSEQEVSENGINLGEMNKLLIKKVEELTLYLIQQKEATDKQNKIQQEQINELKSQITKLIKQQ